jgi:hypothetical protein
MEIFNTIQHTKCIFPNTTWKFPTHSSTHSTLLYTQYGNFQYTPAHQVHFSKHNMEIYNTLQHTKFIFPQQQRTFQHTPAHKVHFSPHNMEIDYTLQHTKYTFPTISNTQISFNHRFPRILKYFPTISLRHSEFSQSFSLPTMEFSNKFLYTVGMV